MYHFCNIFFDEILTRANITGVGGQIDFIQGASLGLDGRGKPIIAMLSTTKRKESKIVPMLQIGESYRYGALFLILLIV